MVIVAAAGESDKECGTAATAAAAVDRVEALMMLLIPSREQIRDSLASAHSATAAVDVMKALSVLKAQCCDLALAGSRGSQSQHVQQQQQQQQQRLPEPPATHSTPNLPSPSPRSRVPAINLPTATPPPPPRLPSRTPPTPPLSSSRSTARQQTIPSKKSSPASEHVRALERSSPLGRPASSSLLTPSPSAAPDLASLAASAYAALKSQVVREEDFFAVASAALLAEALRQVRKCDIQLAVGFGDDVLVFAGAFMCLSRRCR
jgi:hypothetical protein